MIDGVIVVNKPDGWTSHDVVAKMRGIAATKRVGHLGTLDPIATGVLPVMIGQATRLARFWERQEKTYEAVVRFGFATDTYDRQGAPVGPVTEPELDGDVVEAAIGPLRGDILQKPPAVSAKKVGGVPAYRLARKDKPVDLAPVPVSIYEFALLSVEGPRARVRVRCSAGTYIRSLAHDIGIAVGCGAHVEELVRTRSGSFTMDQAFDLERLQELKNSGRLEEAAIPLAELLPEFPNAMVDENTVAAIRQGRDFGVSAFRVNLGTKHVKAIGPDGRLVAIGEICLPHVYHPVVVLQA